MKASVARIRLKSPRGWGKAASRPPLHCSLSKTPRTYRGKCRCNSCQSILTKQVTLFAWSQWSNDYDTSLGKALCVARLLRRPLAFNRWTHFAALRECEFWLATLALRGMTVLYLNNELFLCFSALVVLMPNILTN